MADRQALAARLMQIETPAALRTLIDWRPQPKQAEFLRAAGMLDWFLHDGAVQPPAARLLGYGGAAGGGKSDTLLMLGVMICWAFPGAKVTYFRRKYTELEGPDGAIQRSMVLFGNLGGGYNEQKKRWKFPNGSYLFFRHVHNEKDIYDYQSQQFHVLLIDEATHFTWPMVDYLVTRNRSTVAGMWPFAAMASNPGNIGHAWYSSIFDIQDNSGGELGPHGQVKLRMTPNEKDEQVHFTPARLEDNAILRQIDPDYERKLEARNPDLVAALRWGSWTQFVGQAFKVWQRSRHVLPPAAPRPEWPKWRAVDWGTHNPFCCLWLAMNPTTRRVFVYRELYAKGMTDREQARTIQEMTPPDEKIYTTYADPSMWAERNRAGEVFTTVDEYAAEGVVLSKADNDRMGGKRKIDRLLADLADGAPGLLVTESCTNLIRTLPLLVYDQTNVEDIDTSGEDHAYDALRYGLTNYRIDAGKKREREKSALERLGRVL